MNNYYHQLYNSKQQQQQVHQSTAMNNGSGQMGQMPAGTLTLANATTTANTTANNPSNNGNEEYIFKESDADLQGEELMEKFEEELRSMSVMRLPVSRTRIENLTFLAMNDPKMYKYVVALVEKFLGRAHPACKLWFIYLLDNIVRKAKQLLVHNDVYSGRFSRNLVTTVQTAALNMPANHKPLLIKTLNIWYRHSFFPDEMLAPLLQEFCPDWQKNMESKAPVSQHHGGHHNHGGGHHHQQKANSNNSWGKVSSSHRASSSTANNNGSLGASGANGSNNGSASTIATSSLFSARVQAFKANFVGLTEERFSDDDDDDNENGDAEEDQNGDEDQDQEPNLQDQGTPTESEPPYMRPPNLSGLSHQLSSKIGNFANLVNNIFVSSDRRLKSLSQAAEQFGGRGPENEGLGQEQAAATSGMYPPPISELKCYTPPEIAPNSQYMPPPPLEFLALERDEVGRRGESRLNKMALLPPPPQPLPQATSNAVDMDVDDGMIAYEPEDCGVPYPDSSNSLAALREKTMYENLSKYSIRVHPTQQYTNYQHIQQQVQSYDQQQQQQNQNHQSARPTPPYVDSTSGGNLHHPSGQSLVEQTGTSYSSASEPVSAAVQPALSRQQIKDAAAAEAERIRLRKAKGMATSFKANCLVISSTTLWIGHVPKFASESDLSDFFGEYGEIRSINMIPSRGCAYVCMVRRLDAYRAYTKLKKTNKLLGHSVKCAWAAGKALKEKNFSDCWDDATGTSVIPYNLLKTTDGKDVDLNVLEEGGCIEEDTVPEHLKATLKSSNLLADYNNQHKSENNEQEGNGNPEPNQDQTAKVETATSLEASNAALWAQYNAAQYAASQQNQQQQQQMYPLAQGYPMASGYPPMGPVYPPSQPPGPALPLPPFAHPSQLMMGAYPAGSGQPYPPLSYPPGSHVPAVPPYRAPFPPPGMHPFPPSAPPSNSKSSYLAPPQPLLTQPNSSFGRYHSNERGGKRPLHKSYPASQIPLPPPPPSSTNSQAGPNLDNNEEKKTTTAGQSLLPAPSTAVENSFKKGKFENKNNFNGRGKAPFAQGAGYFKGGKGRGRGRGGGQMNFAGQMGIRPFPPPPPPPPPPPTIPGGSNGGATFEESIDDPFGPSAFEQRFAPAEAIFGMMNGPHGPPMPFDMPPFPGGPPMAFGGPGRHPHPPPFGQLRPMSGGIPPRLWAPPGGMPHPFPLPPGGRMLGMNNFHNGNGSFNRGGGNWNPRGRGRQPNQHQTSFGNRFSIDNRKQAQNRVHNGGASATPAESRPFLQPDDNSVGGGEEAANSANSAASMLEKDMLEPGFAGVDVVADAIAAINTPGDEPSSSTVESQKLASDQ